MRVAIIGGGASGLMCGAVLAQNGIETVIFDGNEKVGKKLYLTGKGRCNLTNACDVKEFLDNVVCGKKFLISLINRFSSFDCIKFFEDNGLKLKVERGNRVFPVSDKSSDVIKTLQRLNKQNQIRLNCKVKNIKHKGDKFVVVADDEEVFDKVVVATGGKSYSATGSTGDGYRFAKAFGHNVTQQVPALVAIQLKDNLGSLQGLTLKNVSLKAKFTNQDGKAESKSLFGDLLFTDKGISGPIVLSMSSLTNRATDIQLALDLKPALSEAQLEARLLRDFDANKNKDIKYIIAGLLPKSMIEIFLDKINILPGQKVNSTTKQQRLDIIALLKHFPLEYKAHYPLESGIITSGGVSTQQINPKTCESKLVKGLYFVGEVLDVDCLTGGFNLQVAFATAQGAAQDIVLQNNN